jgi:DNA-directed RNA polymerase I, II, and III subunit RPABC1
MICSIQYVICIYYLIIWLCYIRKHLKECHVYLYNTIGKVMNPIVRVTLHEMLHDRGYDKVISTTDPNDISFSVENEENGKRILVYFIYDPKVSVKRVKLIKVMLDENPGMYQCLILVYKNTITSFAKQFITTDVSNLFVQAFSEVELSYNITHHKLVPKHEIVSVDEKKQIMQQYRTTLKHFPLMLSSDPVSRYYGLLPGTMVRITRKSPTSGEHTLYRVVV